MIKEKKGISIIVPCFNEAQTIQSTISRLRNVFDTLPFSYEIIVINDGSRDATDSHLEILKSDKVKVFANEFNLGYGRSIKVGIEKSTLSWIGIIDADGTYPVEQFKKFVDYMDEFDMIVGVRTAKKREIPILRRPAKWFLNRFCSYMVKRKITDINSGMRLIKRELVIKYWPLFPEGFSFTTTLTMAAIMGNFRIKNVPIEYFKRKGHSKIRPFHDTSQFFLLVLRVAMMFNPLRIFIPTFLFTFLLTIVSIIRDFYNMNLSETTVMLFIFAAVILLIGLMADLVNRRLS